jgi:hypothetical protein
MEERMEQIKTTNRNLSPLSGISGVSGRQNVYKNNSKMIKKSLNSKYYMNSSSKKTNNQINNTSNTIESSYNIKSIFENSNDEKNYQNLATNIRIQNNIIEEYQKWINILLTAINNKKIESSYNDIGTPIQEGLEDIEKLKMKNFEIKSVIIKKKISNENLEKQIEKNKKMQNMLIKEYNEKDKSNGLNIKKEKEQLIFNVQMLANELDELNENNKQLYDKIQNNEKLKSIYDLMTVKNQLKEENKLYKKMIVLKNRKNYMDKNGTLSVSKSINNTNYRIRKIKRKIKNNYDEEEYGSLGPISGYGEYKLEKEENVNKSFFFCGL